MCLMEISTHLWRWLWWLWRGLQTVLVVGVSDGGLVDADVPGHPLLSEPLLAAVTSTGPCLPPCSWSWNLVTIPSLLRINDLTIGWQNLNPLSHPNATLAPQERQAKWWHFELLAELILWYPGKIIDPDHPTADYYDFTTKYFLPLMN